MNPGSISKRERVEQTSERSVCVCVCLKEEREGKDEVLESGEREGFEGSQVLLAAAILLATYAGVQATL